MAISDGPCIYLLSPLSSKERPLLVSAVWGKGPELLDLRFVGCQEDKETLISSIIYKKGTNNIYTCLIVLALESTYFS